MWLQIRSDDITTTVNLEKVCTIDINSNNTVKFFYACDQLCDTVTLTDVQILRLRAILKAEIL
jgi:hypothetical protein